MDEQIKQIKNTKRYFISNKGYCFKIKGTREIVLPIRMIRGVPRVLIQNEKRNLVMMIIEYFVEEIPEHFKYTYKVKEGRISLENIGIVDTDLMDEDTRNIVLYKCDEKANSSNSRVKHLTKLTSVDVLNCLKRTNFKCFYCNDSINKRSWHLDHITPISRGGLNQPKNITSCCKQCNMMKGAYEIVSFVDKCKKISDHFESLKK